MVRSIGLLVGLYLTAGLAQATEIPLGYPAPLKPEQGETYGTLYKLDGRYTDGTIYNPVTGKDDPVRLRTYVGNTTDWDVPYAGPRIDVWPGETVRLRLTNNLPADDPSCADAPPAINTPHCFNVTNLHLHGFWISPQGNSDNVNLSIHPGVTFEYEFNIPADHPAGTFWYHPHHHGSTALQVSSGMAAPLIVRGNRLPTTERNGDIDTLLKQPDGTPFSERIVLMQQIPYACRDDNGDIREREDETWYCNDGDVGTVELYDQFGQTTWDDSGRSTSLNGRIIPTFTGARAGIIERWRAIHAGVRGTEKLRFRKLADGANPEDSRGVSVETRKTFIDEHCSGPVLTTFSIALDGLTRARAVPQREALLQPAYREDLLVTFPDAGTYCIIDGEVDAAESVSALDQDRALLGFVRVDDGPGMGGQDVETFVTDALVDAAENHMPDGVRSKIVRDLNAGLSLASFVDHKDIADDELTGKQTLGFRYHNIHLNPDPPKYQHEVGYLGTSIGGEMILINSQPFDPNRIDRTLMLGGADEWKMTSFWGGHPFHIHINPFQIVSIVDKDGNDVSGSAEDGGSGQFANLKGAWKDTLFIEEGYVFTLRMRYERYVGDFVLHCHILDHEDKGMMQNVRIAVPGASPGMSMAH